MIAKRGKMSKFINGQKARYYIILLIVAIIFYGSCGCIGYAEAYEVEYKIVSYSFEGKILSSVEVVKGDTMVNTLDSDACKDDFLLKPDEKIVWHIGSVDGEVWTNEYVVVEDITFHGVKTLKTPMDDTIIDFPDENADGGEENNNGEEQESIVVDEEIDNENSQENVNEENENSASGSEVIKGVEQNNSSDTYNIVVNVEKDYYSVSGVPKKNENITITLKPYDDLILEAVTVFCDNKPIVCTRKGSKISFYMPDGDVEVDFKFSEKTQQAPESVFTRQEIIALSLVGAGIVLSGCYFVIKGIMTKRKMPKKESK